MTEEKQGRRSLINSLLAGLCAALILFFSTRFMPSFYLLTPIPLVVLWASEKRGWTALSAGLALAMTLLFFALAEGEMTSDLFATVLAFFLYPLVMALFLGEALRREADPFSTLVLAAFLFLGILFLMTTIGAQSQGLSNLEDLRQYIEEEVGKAYTRMQAEIPDLNQPASEFALAVNLRNFVQLIPALLFNMGLGFALVQLWVSQNILHRSGVVSRPFIFTDLVLPTQAGKALLLAAIITAILFSLLQGGDYAFIRNNVISIINGILLLDGLSILDFFLKRSRLPAWLRILIYLLLVSSASFSLALPFLSILNIFMDFRHRPKKEA